MSFMSKISSLLAFRTAPTTLIIILVYLAVAISVFITNQLPGVPKHQKGLDLKQAYADLHHIAPRPHPYNSHANDDVRSFILERIKDIALGKDYVHIDDSTSSSSWTRGSSGIYFEANNIVVKVDGTEPEYTNTGAVLFSAHYDSVSTASGATDDGMGVATLIQLIQLLSRKRPRRTAIFNINNGEEDGLHGAFAFMNHPWANISDTFLNLEGAASGGRPILFRATSTAPLYSYLRKNVRHPHANVLSSDGFAKGWIRSDTDYTVYAANGMAGLDVAFYQGRSRYHTKLDAVAYTDGQERSLWSMMEAAEGAGLALLNKKETHDESKTGIPVYFDLFAAILVVFSLSTLFAFNFVLLIVGPIVLILAAVGDRAWQQSRRRDRINGVARSDEENVLQKTWKWAKSVKWLPEIWKHSKFWLALFLAIGLQVLLVLAFIKINPFLVYSSPHLVFFCFFALAYSSLAFTLRFSIGALELPEQQKQIMLVQTYIFTWILLVLSTIVVGKAKRGGVYFVSAWHALVFLACLIGYVEEMFGARGTPGQEDIPRIHYESEDEAPLGHPRDESDASPSENTPLIGHRRLRAKTTRGEESGAVLWWIVQLLLVLPLPIILVSHMAIILLEALPQTLADGSSASIVYTALSALAFLLVVPIAPFVFKIHRGLAYVLSAIFIISIIYALSAFPFDSTSPLKVFFQQKVMPGDTITPRTANASIATAPFVVTALTGAEKYMKQMLIPKIPSAVGQTINCTRSTVRMGLSTCEWNSSAVVASPGGDVIGKVVVDSKDITQASEWFRATVNRTGSTSARIRVQGQNTRSCRIYADNRNIKKFMVYGSRSSDARHNGQGLRQIKLWSLDRNHEFIVDLEWEAGTDDQGNNNNELQGRISCNWAEYASGMVDNGSFKSKKATKIPAFEEMLSFLPEWAIASKANDGLVEAFRYFKI